MKKINSLFTFIVFYLMYSLTYSKRTLKGIIKEAGGSTNKKQPGFNEGNLNNLPFSQCQKKILTLLI